MFGFDVLIEKSKKLKKNKEKNDFTQFWFSITVKPRLSAPAFSEFPGLAHHFKSPISIFFTTRIKKKDAPHRFSDFTT